MVVDSQWDLAEFSFLEVVFEEETALEEVVPEVVSVALEEVASEEEAQVVAGSWVRIRLHITSECSFLFQTVCEKPVQQLLPVKTSLQN